MIHGVFMLLVIPVIPVQTVMYKTRAKPTADTWGLLPLSVPVLDAVGLKAPQTEFHGVLTLCKIEHYQFIC